MKYDINKIMDEYKEFDFGFTTVDDAEYQAVIAEKDETVEEYITKSTTSRENHHALFDELIEVERPGTHSLAKSWSYHRTTNRKNSQIDERVIC